MGETYYGNSRISSFFLSPPYWGILDLTGQHKPTKNKLIKIWDELLNDFRLDVAWKMIELDRSEIELFDNIEVMIVYMHLTIAFDLVTRSF